MKFFISFIAIFLTGLHLHSQSKKNDFIVERYRISNYAFGGNIKEEITEKRKYSADNDLLFKIDYHGLKLYDSSVYFNQGHRIIKLVKFDNVYGVRERENVDYYYQEDGLIDVKVNKTEFSQSTKQDYVNNLPRNNVLGFKDPLGILENDFNDFDIEGMKPLKPTHLVHGAETFIKQGYIINSTARGLFDYNIPHFSYLKRINLFYTSDKTLLRDEFIFDKFILKRKYFYSSEGIKSMKIVKLKNHHIISSDSINFKYITLRIYNERQKTPQQ